LNIASSASIVWVAVVSAAKHFLYYPPGSGYYTSPSFEIKLKTNFTDKFSENVFSVNIELKF